MWLAVVRGDGSPHLTPVWFLYDEGTWWISTAAANRKVAHLGANDRVSLALPDAQRPLVAQGVATIHTGPAPAWVIAAFAQKYRGWDITDEDRDGPRVLVEVCTTRWLMSGSAR